MFSGNFQITTDNDKPFSILFLEHPTATLEQDLDAIKTTLRLRVLIAEENYIY